MSSLLNLIKKDEAVELFCNNKNKQFIKTVNFFGTTLYNSKIGDVGTDIAYIKVTDAFKYMRLSNGTSILKSVKMYPISNEDFNKHLIFNVGK